MSHLIIRKKKQYMDETRKKTAEVGPSQGRGRCGYDRMVV
jgi:hypothetical protein